MKFTSEEIKEVPCIQCDAPVGQPCIERSFPMIGYHRKRLNLRKRYPVTLQAEGSAVLSPTDKSIITYFAYVMLCDSCAANSEKLFGKEFTSQEIQRMFANEAVKAARLEGLLK